MANPKPDPAQEIQAPTEAVRPLGRGHRLLAEKMFRELEETHWKRLGIDPPSEQNPAAAR